MGGRDRPLPSRSCYRIIRLGRLQLPPNWYKKRGYPHFDLPKNAEEAESYVSDPGKIARHSFFPFLAFDMIRRRYKSKAGAVNVSTKIRPIRMAAHVDGYIFSYYARLIADLYEERIQGTSLSDCVLAYRKGRGSNIDFAKAAFDEVDRRRMCSAIALDIEGFFDSIDHEVLRQQWVKVVNGDRLPGDHFKVFRAVTRYVCVDRDACYKVLGIVEKTAPRPLCSAKEFREKVRGGGLIEVNKLGYGIPQGSPMSAILSNVYLLPFDMAMTALAERIDGHYRRYCDDILWIVAPQHEELVQESTRSEIGKLGAQIHVKDSKTVVSRFSEDGTLEPGSPPFQYLGFTYDGKRRLIRSQTLSRFWRKVTFSVRAARKRAKRAKNGKVFRRKIYRNCTHLGKRNFFSYARRAQRTMRTPRRTGFSLT